MEKIAACKLYLACNLYINMKRLDFRLQNLN